MNVAPLGLECLSVAICHLTAVLGTRTVGSFESRRRLEWVQIETETPSSRGLVRLLLTSERRRIRGGVACMDARSPTHREKDGGPVNMKANLGFSLSAVVVTTLLFAGCGDDNPIEEVEQVVDCAEICGRYSECVEQIDVTACTDACEDRIEVDESVGDQAEACEDCLNDRACQEIETAGCFDNCPVVPLQD